MVTVNGNEVGFVEGETLSALILRCGFSGSRIAAEVNGRIVPRAHHDEYIVGKDDRIEIVGLIGGG